MSGIYGLQSNFSLPKVIVYVTVVIVIAHTLVAAVYGNDCPKEPFIPIYLWGHLFGAVILLVLFQSNLDVYLCVTAVFFICWLIAGSIKIHSISEPNFKNTTADSYCNKTLYLYAVWSTTMTDVILAGFFLIGVIDYFFPPIADARN
ncbi:transmembrane protein 272-like isoform X3 [Thunnus thynnus]|uniref:transmembrane protein 272-like isoform X3 n=1 Tax=Thunnus thynnus TaxID=8237 RepID=UPI0035285989